MQCVLMLLVVASLALSVADLVDFEAEVQKGIQLHHRYMHRKGTELIVAIAKRVPHHQIEICNWLIDDARALLDENRKDEVGSRGLLESAMAVALLAQDAETLYNIANLFLTANAPPQALEGYRAVQTLLPTLASAYHQVGLTYSRMNKLEESFEAYNFAIQLLPSYAITYNNIGVLLSKQGRLEEALAHYQAALSIDQNYHDARNNVDSALAQMETKEREASVTTLEEEEARLVVPEMLAPGSSELLSHLHGN